MRSKITNVITASASVKSARRAFELLEFFAVWRRPASIKEISATLGYPQSSTSMLIKTLVDAGYFDYEPRTRMYTPNVRLGLATAWIEQSLFSELSLLRLMEGLLERTGHTVIISAQKGTQLQYVHLLSGTRPNRVTSRIGVVRLLFRCAPGKMLLSAKSERDIATLISRVNAEEEDASRRLDLVNVRAELSLCRRRGWATSFNEAVANAGSVAILLPLPRGHKPLSLSIGGPVQEIREECDELVSLLNSSVTPLRAALSRRY